MPLLLDLLTEKAGGPGLGPVNTQGQDFKITVLEGPLANEANFHGAGSTAAQYTLRGRALPYRGVSFETEQRTKTVYYPGNPIATQQVMGPIEKPTTITGWWKDVFLGNGNARAMCDLFRNLCRSGYRVEVSWGVSLDSDAAPLANSQPIVRRGVVKRFKHTYDRPQDVQWEIEFEFIGDDALSTPAFSSVKNVDPLDGFDDARGSLQDTVDSIVSFRNNPYVMSVVSLPSQVNSVLDSAQESITNCIDFFDASLNAMQGTAELPAHFYERMNAVGQQGVASCQLVKDTFIGMKRSLLSAGDDPLGPLQNQANYADVIATADNAQAVTASAISAAQALLLPEVLAEVKPIPGTDLRDLALKWYGNPDLWYLIADFNGMATSLVPMPPSGASDLPHFVIKIPRRSQSLQSGAGVQGY